MLRSTYKYLLKFSSIKTTDPIMIFASYPVGFPILKTLHNNFKDLAVVTHYTNPNVRVKNEVQIFCKSHNIQCFYPVKKETTKQQRQKQWAQFVQQIKKKQKNYKFGVACAYGYMIPENVLKLFEKGMVLAHPSLIPKYRGGSPIFHAIANGQKQSGVSFMQISPNQFDQGSLLYQVKHPLGQKDSYQKVQKELSQLMANQVMHVIQNIENLRPGKRQSELNISGIPPHQLIAKIYKHKNLDINLKAQEVYNWSRALIGPRVKFNDSEIIVFFEKVFLDDPQNSFQPGQLKLKGKHLYMKCADKFLKLSGWQQIAKKPLAIHTFINRFIDKQKYQNQIIFKKIQKQN